MEQRTARYAPFAGALFVVLAVVSFGVEGDTPDTDDSAEVIVDFYTDNDTRVIVASLIAAVAALAALAFASSLRSALRERGGPGLFAAIAYGGGVVAAAGMATDAAIRFAIANSVGDISPEGTEALFAFWNGFFWPIHVGLAALMLATCVSAFETKIIPVPLAILGVLAAVALFVPPPIAFVGLALGSLWVLIVSFLLWRQEAAREQTTPAPS